MMIKKKKTPSKHVQSALGGVNKKLDEFPHLPMSEAGTDARERLHSEEI